jgi:hypothetical protein
MADMMHVPTCDKLSDEFLTVYQKDFEITDGGHLETFLGIEVEQPGKVIKLRSPERLQGVYQEITWPEACSDVPWISP